MGTVFAHLALLVDSSPRAELENVTQPDQTPIRSRVKVSQRQAFGLRREWQLFECCLPTLRAVILVPVMFCAVRKTIQHLFPFRTHPDV